jgi:hypothetical protein
VTDELREAAERYANPKPSEAYPWPCDMHEQPMRRSRDAAVLARAYIAEHPADSELPVTEDWLRAVGFTADTDGTVSWFRKADLELYDQSPHGWKSFVGARMLRPVSARGQLRGLCHWLCVALPEPPHAPPADEGPS